MLADLKFALRQLRRSPGFTLTAVLTLALGIGANAAIFALVNSILLRPLPFPQQGRIMSIDYGNGAFAALVPKGWIRALGDHSSSFQSISGFGEDAESNVGDQNSTDRVFGSDVMTNALSTLGVQPAVGRFFSADDAMAGHDPVVVLSYGYWRQRFAADPDVIGRTLRIDGVDRTVIGVMPAGVRFPYADTEFLTPVTFKGGDPTDPWVTFDLRAFGRLKPGVSPGQAQAELLRLRPGLLSMFPWTMPSRWANDMTVVPLLESEVGAMRPRLILLFVAVGLILLIACANVAGLMVARASSREREIAVRGALGATPGRLIRQLLSESVVLGVLAGIVGLLAAAASLRALVTLLPANTPRLADVSLHWSVFLFAAGASVFAGILFGVIPALKMASPDLRDSLHAGSRSVAGKPGQFRVSMALVVAQIALSVIIITAAGLMLHSLWSLSQVNPGFRTSRIVTAEVSMDATACPAYPGAPASAPTGPQGGRCQGFFGTLLNRLDGVPGEESAALTDTLPLHAMNGTYVFDAEGHPRNAHGLAMLAAMRTVSPGYFATLGMGLERGRLLEEQDASGVSRAVVIDRQMANQLWPHESPLGRHVENVGDEPTPGVMDMNKAAVVVGVVNNTREGSLADSFENVVYLPMTPADEHATMFVLLRTHATTQQAASEIRQAVADIDSQVPVTRVRSLNEVIATSESAPRSLALLLLAFGVLAVVIGGVGVYSLIAYTVNWRTREIGIRLALGAQRAQILNAVIRQSLLVSAGGCVLGLAGAALAAQLLHSFLYGVSTLDPVTFSAVALLMVVLAITTAWIPARRAASVDPILTLRQE